MKYFSFTSLLVLLLQLSFAQSPTDGMKRVFIQEYGSGIFTRISEIPGRPSDGPVGSSLINEDWIIGNVYLKGKEKIMDYPLRYDALHKWIEIKVEGEIKILPINRIEGFEWKDPTGQYFIPFVNAEEYIMDSNPTEGIFEILSFEEKGYSAFSKREIEIIPANYNPSFNSGSKDDKITQKERLYLVDTSSKEVFRIKKNRKKNLEFFGPKAEEMTLFIKKNKLDFADRADLVKIIEKVNNL